MWHTHDNPWFPLQHRLQLAGFSAPETALSSERHIQDMLSGHSWLARSHLQAYYVYVMRCTEYMYIVCMYIYMCIS